MADMRMSIAENTNTDEKRRTRMGRIILDHTVQKNLTPAPSPGGEGEKAHTDGTDNFGSHGYFRK